MENMKEIIAGQMKEMRDRIEQHAGPEVCIKVLAGSEEAAEFTNPVDNAFWMKEAIDRLDALTNDDTREKIMSACGRHCHENFKQFSEEARARRLKYDTEEEFLQDELNPPPDTGVRFERDGDIIYNYYTPRQYGKGMRCYCYLIGALPQEWP